MKWVATFFLLVCSTLVKADNSIQKTTEWLNLIDTQAYQHSWKVASLYLQSNVTESDWAISVQTARHSLGTLTSRHLIESTDHNELPGAPDGTYRVMIFRSSFENKANANETVVLSKLNGLWQPAGYFIK